MHSTNQITEIAPTCAPNALVTIYSKPHDKMSVQGLRHKALLQNLCKLAQFSLSSKISWLHRNTAKYAQKIRKIISGREYIEIISAVNAPEIALDILTNIFTKYPRT